MTRRKMRGEMVHRSWRLAQWVGTAFLGAVLFLVLWIWASLQPVNAHDHQATYVRIVPGQSAAQIGLVLYQKKLIRSALAFRLLTRFSHQARSLQSGVYRLSPSQNPQQMLAMMEEGKVVTIRVSIPEGFTVQQIVHRLVMHHIGTTQKFAALLKTPLPGMPKPAAGVKDPYEGYLFPATYQFPYGTTAKQALTTMWTTFTTRALPLYKKSHSTLSLSQWVTLASIVQVEDKNPGDASKIAGVFINRLKIGMPLQSDATVRYAIGHPIAGSLSYANLQVVSPYNTYLHKGLPPGPISNPGILALKAALYPARVPYLYFIALPNGHTLFATTYQQQLANIQYANQHF
ncbi:endolytic transglycosylase MltG [Sulfobacillus thermosulfidooxidans]|uniref:endolytic transglycosylase MltG n=1 Tax=Sulfobacillus thermosulfidooxidans TaxID=28034 RepID=UPI001FA6E85A|nr:endolytic transglycosylase MltG [Sulfobacillus thermosulfidooxidans]